MRKDIFLKTSQINGGNCCRKGNGAFVSLVTTINEWIKNGIIKVNTGGLDLTKGEQKTANKWGDGKQIFAKYVEAPLKELRYVDISEYFEPNEIDSIVKLETSGDFMLLDYTLDSQENKITASTVLIGSDGVKKFVMYYTKQ